MVVVVVTNKVILSTKTNATTTPWRQTKGPTANLHLLHIHQHMDALHWPCIPILKGTSTWCFAEH